MKKKRPLKNISCRMIAKDDVNAVVELYKEAFSSIDTEEISKRVKGKSNRAMVATKRSGQIIGFILFDIETNNDEKSMYVANVGVSSSQHSRGVCSVMVPWLVARMPRYRVKFATLSVSSHNQSAVRCYTGAGFEKDSSTGMMRCEPPKKKRKSKKKKAA